ncbi:MAG: hypothetical protein Q9216_005144 [Gyalolechia sp. 2 TL-2023]
MSADSMRARERPDGVSLNQYLNRRALPQPQYPAAWAAAHPPNSVPPPSLIWPVPWSNVLQLNGQFTWDTGKYPALAHSGGRVNDYCVKAVGQGGRDSGGVTYTGRPDRTTKVQGWD